jgi:hypothetical protein
MDFEQIHVRISLLQQENTIEKKDLDLIAREKLLIKDIYKDNHIIKIGAKLRLDYKHRTFIFESKDKRITMDDYEVLKILKA